MTAIPERLRWAVEMLTIRPDDRLLEIGCGRGVAVSLVAPRLEAGHIVAIDRSPAAISVARERNRDHVATGRAVFHTVALEGAQLDGQRFGKIFAINVNAFWLQPDRTLPAARDLLEPGGMCFLFLQPPGEDRTREFAETMPRHLRDHGFIIDQVLIEPMRPAPAACVIARAG